MMQNDPIWGFHNKHNFPYVMIWDTKRKLPDTWTDKRIMSNNFFKRVGDLVILVATE